MGLLPPCPTPSALWKPLRLAGLAGDAQSLPVRLAWVAAYLFVQLAQLVLLALSALQV